MEVTQVRGLLCEAVYQGTKFRKWEGRDKENPGRMRTFRTLTHRFSWPTDDGDEFMHIVEWLPDDSKVASLKDCAEAGLLHYQPGPYNLQLRGLKEEGGVLQAQTRAVTPLNGDNLAGHEPVTEEPSV